MSSDYNKAFFEGYKLYLADPEVEKRHRRIFAQFRNSIGKVEHLDTLDIGCGMGTYFTRGHYAEYIGVDLINTGRLPQENFIQHDYHDLKGIIKKLPAEPNFQPNIIVSLYSIELIHSAKEKYSFYGQLFTAFPSVTDILTLGFVYLDRADQDIVEETIGGEVIRSYQSIERQELHISPLFEETRICYSNPSIFGADVVDVAKFLKRRI